MKRTLATLLLVLVVMSFTGAASADSLQYGTQIGGGITINGTPTGVSVSFNNLAFTGSVPAGDSAVGTPLVFSNPALFFASAGGGVGSATGPNPQFTAGDSTSGILTADIGSVTLYDNAGGFRLVISLVNANFSNCSTLGCTNSGVLSSIQNSYNPNGGATGNFDFTFSLGGPANLSQLLDTTSSSSWVNSNPNGLTGSVAGSVGAVPEPASLALLGTGLVAGGSFIRRKLGR